MPFCGVLRNALSFSHGALAQIVIFLLQNWNISRVQASLPPGAEDEIILIEHLPGRKVHLQDFFWSDAKDAPPWVDPDQGLTIYETRTVHHTVTLYSPAEDTDDNQFPRGDPKEPRCTTCIEPTPRLDDEDDQNIGVLIGEDPGPRYWLLTVLRAGEAIPPKIELKLARLYKTAFSRQQQRHLGLLQTDPRFRRIARGHTLFKSKLESQEEAEKASYKSRAQRSEEATNLRHRQNVSSNKYEDPMFPISETGNFSLRLNLLREGELKSSNKTENSFVTEVQAETGFRNETENRRRGSTNEHNFQNVSQLLNRMIGKQTLNNTGPEDINESKRSELRSLDSGAETVQVRMQNTSVTEGGATKLIYSVHLGGKPVPAETAARDMALLSPQEVALELGAPVLIQSEPYLKETRPLALSRKRDAWLLIGAASVGFILLAFIVLGLIVAAKRKRSHSAVAAPPSQHTLKKNREYIQATGGLDNNAFSTSELDIKTDGTSQRHTPGSLSRTQISLETPDSLDAAVQASSDEEDDSQKRKTREPSPWEHPPKKSRLAHGKMSRSNAIDTPRTSDSMDVVVDQLEALDSLENNYSRTQEEEEATASPHSYLSMPSCKPFPSMKSVEPLSRVLEPVMVKHLDIDSPELVRRDSDHYEPGDQFFARSSSAAKDPGVVGPIVWSLRRQNASTEGPASGTDVDAAYATASRPVGKARRRLHELLEDSFSLFGSRDPKVETYSRPTSAARSPDVLTIFSETRPRTSVPGKPVPDTNMSENGRSVQFRSRGVWSSRPLSAGPFHRPNLPEVDARRILTDSQLPPEDPAVPLIASIKRELEKFSPQ
ncbi:uncharacterized protein LOC108623338 [Ceratina calcarata]|uniref:Uncharacterized protein LOC108623338 n=1 Tax=Ceratina calcarata TaxID=156304 RepID=A0AAJ7IUC1_9HYME|nr:uncharacterized protein LOC108623338 [Ceratina calcarata]